MLSRLKSRIKGVVGLVRGGSAPSPAAPSATPVAARPAPPPPPRAEPVAAKPAAVPPPNGAGAPVAAKVEAPKAEVKAPAPKVEAPKVEAPKVEAKAPAAEPEAPKAEAKAPKAKKAKEPEAVEAKAEAPAPEPVKAEPPKAEPVKAEPPKAEPVKAEAPAPAPVKAEPPKVEHAKAAPAAAAKPAAAPAGPLYADQGSTDKASYILRAKANGRDPGTYVIGEEGMNSLADGTKFWGPVNNDSSRAKAEGKVLTIDQFECISCGTCVEQTDRVFYLPADGKATPIAQDGPMDLIEDAIEQCPVTCIQWVETDEAVEKGLATGMEDAAG